MHHKYDHNCTCPECREYELQLKAMVQHDRASDRAREVRAYEERQRSYRNRERDRLDGYETEG
jgi:ribosomal protein L44E